MSATKLPRQQQDGRRIFFILALTIVVSTTFVPLTTVSALSSSGAIYQRQLQSQVDTTTGAPRSGRDPASQSQNSLSAAASTPSGVGQRVDKPAAKVVGTIRHTSPTSVLPDTKKTGILASGCLLAYGTAGAQCVPARGAGNINITCDFIHTIFPHGVKIVGADTLHLNTGNNTACSK